jgi:hypothetical protein
MLDDLSARPVVIPESGNDIALALVGQHVVAAHSDDEPGMLHTYRVWDISGERVGRDGPAGVRIIGAAVRAWPTMYVGRADGSISLTNVESGRDLCPSMLLPTVPRSLTATGEGALVVAFGSDVAVIRPPVD